MNGGSFFATPYTIHFDDTMAYGSHHFLTAFKFQCAAREAFLFGEQVFDAAGVRDALDNIQLFTADAYARNLQPTTLGDRLVILLSIEDWGKLSARFCYRVLEREGTAVCAGFQTLVCADKQGNPIPIPDPLRNAMDGLREIEEPAGEKSFRELVLKSAKSTARLFDDRVAALARDFLAVRQPVSNIVGAASQDRTFRSDNEPSPGLGASAAKPPLGRREIPADSVMCFSGQGSLDPGLLCQRLELATLSELPEMVQQLGRCESWLAERYGDAGRDFLSRDESKLKNAVAREPDLKQLGIFLQNVLGPALEFNMQTGERRPLLLGHSFGEIPALATAGSFDIVTGLRIVEARCDAVRNAAPAEGGLLVVAADRNHTQDCMLESGSHALSIAGRNHDQQTIVSGPMLELRQLRAQLEKRAIGGSFVDSPTAFHHPSLQAAANRWYESLNGLPIASPSGAVYTTMGRRWLSHVEDIRTHLVSQFLRAFDLQGSLHDLAAIGVKHFIDCGTPGLLSRLLRKAAPEGVVVSCLAEKQEAIDVPSLEQEARAGEDRSVAARTDTARADANNPSEQSGSLDQGTGPEHDSRVNRTRDEQAEAQAPDGTPANAVVIAGTGCLLPGGANSPAQLWAALEQRRSGIVDLRSVDANWSEDFYSEELKPDKSTSHLSGRINDEQIVVPEGMDADVFHGLSRTQQLLCIALVPCLEALRGASRVRCILGATADGFEDQDVVASLRFAGIDAEEVLDCAPRSTSPYDDIKAVLDLVCGIDVELHLVDAACASSLYAVSLGVDTLESGVADAVIAGGVFCPGPGNGCLFSQFNGTTATGLRPFDASADGVVFSEGAACVVLRTFQSAIENQLPVRFRVRGAGLSSDGKSPSANVPQTRGQLLSLARCYQEAGIAPGAIDAIEAHGTSTPTGDATEIRTLASFFDGQVKAPIPVHSLKGLLGHAGWAAGTASVVAAVEYLKRRKFPGQAGFKKAADALAHAQETLSVDARQQALAPGARRIAIDGFGFGGANAHVVVEEISNVTVLPAKEEESLRVADEELVVVAWSQKGVDQGGQYAFDRELGLPPGQLVLPELAEDMDISQVLAAREVAAVLGQLDGFTDELRSRTSIVVAMRGKTERAIEATARIMAPRLKRMVNGVSPYVDRINAMADSCRPSGAYTLQCMMPNVAAGRAALLQNTNGPNFVVDAGALSLEKAIENAALLLRRGELGGTQLAIVAAIQANRFTHLVDPSGPAGEFAAAFGITTRTIANQHGWSVCANYQEMLRQLQAAHASQTEMGSQTRTMVGCLQTGAEQPHESKPPQTEETASVEPPADVELFQPLWVNTTRIAASTSPHDHRSLFLCAAESPALPKLLSYLQHHGPRDAMLVVVGRSAERIDIPDEINGSFLAMDLSGSDDFANLLRKMQAHAPKLVLAVDQIDDWQVPSTLEASATRTELLDALFCTTQSLSALLENGHIGFQALFIDGFDGHDFHPRAGAITGLLKSIQREYPKAQLKTLATKGRTFADGLQHAFAESAHNDGELEVAIDVDQRLVRRMARSPSLGRPATSPHITADSVVLATGGARGVTAVMIDALLKDYGCTVVAVGRSQPEKGPSNVTSAETEQAFYRDFVRQNPKTTAVEMKRAFVKKQGAWEVADNLARFRRSSGRVHYIAADLTDAEQAQKVAAEVQELFGKVDVVVHGAGVQKSKRLVDRSLEEFRNVYATKIAGLANLVAAFESKGQSVPECIHCLTSAYSLFGNDGQHDYGAANETLDRLASLARNSLDLPWSSLAWLAWDGVGMTRGSEYSALAKQRSLSAVTASMGQKLFREVIQGKTAAAINVPLSSAEHSRYQVQTFPIEFGQAPDSRLSPSRNSEFKQELTLSAWIDQHQVKGVPTVPGAWIVDLMVAAALQHTESAHASVAVLEDIELRRFLKLVRGKSKDVRVAVSGSTRGMQVSLLHDIVHPTGAILHKDLVCASAKVQFVNSSSLTAVLGPVHDARGDLRSDPYVTGQGSVSLSGGFDCLEDIEIGSDGRSAVFHPSEDCSRWTTTIPALLLDAAWRVGAMHAEPDQPSLVVPVKIGKLVLPVATGKHKGPAEFDGYRIRSRQPLVTATGATWSRTEVLDRSGVVIATVEDATAQRIANSPQRQGGTTTADSRLQQSC